MKLIRAALIDIFLIITSILLYGVAGNDAFFLSVKIVSLPFIIGGFFYVNYWAFTTKKQEYLELILSNVQDFKDCSSGFGNHISTMEHQIRELRDKRNLFRSCLKNNFSKDKNYEEYLQFIDGVEDSVLKGFDLSLKRMNILKSSQPVNSPTTDVRKEQMEKINCSISDSLQKNDKLLMELNNLLFEITKLGESALDGATLDSLKDMVSAIKDLNEEKDTIHILKSKYD